MHMNERIGTTLAYDFLKSVRLLQDVHIRFHVDLFYTSLWLTLARKLLVDGQMQSERSGCSDWNENGDP